MLRLPTGVSGAGHETFELETERESRVRCTPIVSRGGHLLFKPATILVAFSSLMPKYLSVLRLSQPSFH